MSAVAAAAARPCASSGGRRSRSPSPAASRASSSLLAFAPVAARRELANNLIQLYFLVIIAMMWNALAGYGGPRLRRAAGLHRHRRLRAPSSSRPALAQPVPVDAARDAHRRRDRHPGRGRRAVAARRRVRDRDVGRRRGVRDPRLARPESASAAAPARRRCSPFNSATRRRSGCTTPTGLALGAVGDAPAPALRPAAQPPRRLAPGDPRRRGGGRVGRRARAARQGDPLRRRRRGLRGGRDDDPRLAALDPAARPGLDLRHQLDGEDDLHGARRRPRHVRGPDHRRRRALRAPDPTARTAASGTSSSSAGSRSASRSSCRAASGGRSRNASTSSSCRSGSAAADRSRGVTTMEGTRRHDRHARATSSSSAASGSRRGRRTFEDRDPFTGDVVATARRGRRARTRRPRSTRQRRRSHGWRATPPRRAAADLPRRRPTSLEARRDEVVSMLARETGCDVRVRDVPVVFVPGLFRQAAALAVRAARAGHPVRHRRVRDGDPPAGRRRRRDRAVERGADPLRALDRGAARARQHGRAEAVGVVAVVGRPALGRDLRRGRAARRRAQRRHACARRGRPDRRRARRAPGGAPDQLHRLDARPGGGSPRRRGGT